MFENQKPYCRPGNPSGETYFFEVKYISRSWGFFQCVSSLNFVSFSHTGFGKPRQCIYVGNRNKPTDVPCSWVWLLAYSLPSIAFRSSINLFSFHAQLPFLTPRGTYPVQLVSFPIFRFIFENGVELFCLELLMSFDYSSQVLVFISNNAY